MRKTWDARYRAKHKQRVRAASTRWKKRNPDYAAKYYQRNKKKILARTKKYREENLAIVRKRNKVQYDRTRKQHFAGRDCCDICGKKRKLVIDHDHEFARKHCKHQPTRHCRKCRRGALCHSCNVSLGMVDKYRTSVLLYLDLWRR